MGYLWQLPTSDGKWKPRKQRIIRWSYCERSVKSTLIFNISESLSVSVFVRQELHSAQCEGYNATTRWNWWVSHLVTRVPFEFASIKDEIIMNFMTKIVWILKVNFDIWKERMRIEVSTGMSRYVGNWRWNDLPVKKAVDNFIVGDSFYTEVR